MVSGRLPVARLELLGGVRLRSVQGIDATPRSAKGRAMLAYLALAPGGRVDRGRLAGLLWSESADAKTSLRQCVKELRHTLTTAGLEILAIDTHRLQLDLGALEVDALEVDRLARLGSDGDVAALAAAYAGDLLDGIEIRDPAFDEWLVIERARLRQRVCGVLEQALRTRERRPDLVATAAEALLQLEPAHEEAHQALIGLHSQRGDVAAALRQYEACRTALRRKLDAVPSAETEALLREIKKRDPPEQPLWPLPVMLPGQKLHGPIVAPRAVPRATIAIEQRVSTASDPIEEAVVAALATSLREALARNRWLSVVDAAPAAHLIGSPAVADEGLGYRVMLSLLRGRQRVRFCLELKAVETGRILWAEHYDRSLGDDVFDLVDDLAAALASRLDREVELAEVMRAWMTPIEALSAYDCVLRAIPLVFRLTPEAMVEAEKLLIRAQETDPYEPLVYAWRAFWYFLAIGQGLPRDPQAARAELAWLVRRAIELDPKNALALAVAGHVASYVDHDYDTALGHFEQALKLDPNSVYAWDLSATTLCYTGNAREAIARLQRCRVVWQHDPNPFFFRITACIAHLLAGEHEQAIALGLRTIRENPNFHAAYQPLLAALGHAGRVEEAQRLVATMRRIEPDFSVGRFRARYPPLHPDYATHYIAGLRKAGVPEE